MDLTPLRTDSIVAIIYESNYEPYGPGYDESGSEDYRYTGKQEDPSGLYYYGARYYDPVTGRFTTRDKVFGDLSDPQSLNRYSYCRNNPHKYVDPDGRLPIIAGALIGGGLNLVTYMITTDKANWNAAEMIATTASGMIIGGITCGVGLYTQELTLVGRIIVNAVADEIAVGIGTATEMVIEEALGDPDRDKKIETIGEGFSEATVDPTVDATAEVIITVTGGTGNEMLDEVITESISGIISWAIAHPDRWSLQDNYTPSSISYTSSKSYSPVMSEINLD